jgi:hypothetical protein
MRNCWSMSRWQLREGSRWQYWVLQYYGHQTCSLSLHYDSSKCCVCPLYKFIYSFKVNTCNHRYEGHTRNCKTTEREKERTWSQAIKFNLNITRAYKNLKQKNNSRSKGHLYYPNIAEICNYKCVQDYWVFGLCPSSGILKKQKNRTFQKQDVFVSSGKGWETPPLLGLREHSHLC